MRHRVYGKHLSRNKNERTGLFRNLVASLVISEKIQTTEAKAKAIRGLVDKLITQAKSPTAKRLVSQFLINKPAHEKLINELLPRLQNRNSGYTSTIKLGRRAGDGAMLVQMSLLVETSGKSLESSKKTNKAELKSLKVAEADALKLEAVESEVKNENAKVKSISKKSKVEKKGDKKS